jgi:hypothetical protein
MNTPGGLHLSIRAGAFSDLRSADRAVARLLAAGFSKEQITVVCSNETKERHFSQFEHHFPQFEDLAPSNSKEPMGPVAGASIGAAMGGLSAIAFGLASGGVPLLIAGLAGVSGGCVMGGFLDAILTEEGESKFGKFYDRAIQNGKILVAAEDHGPHSEAKLAQAANIISDAGVESVFQPAG